MNIVLCGTRQRHAATENDGHRLQAIGAGTSPDTTRELTSHRSAQDVTAAPLPQNEACARQAGFATCA